MPADASATVALAAELIARESVTPEDAGCLDLIGERLRAIGFALEPMRFGEVDNLWARRGAARPLLAFAGHTDVVPTGPLQAWRSPPFTPTFRDGRLYGRGAADMKGSLAAMVTACERFVAAHPDHRGSIAVLFTSDEEGPAVDGTVRVIEQLSARGDRIDWCLVGEPSSQSRLGDVCKVGRRGSLSARLVVHGKQGHVAYPQLADNPIHRFAGALHRLVAVEWDQGNAYFPPTSLQISNMHAGAGAGNVIPGELEVEFNLRYSTELDHRIIQSRVAALLDDADLDYDITWTHGGLPFLTEHGELVAAVRAAVRDGCGIEPEFSTTGGTSDGRFIAPTGAQVVELGPLNASIHQVNECVDAAELDRLSDLYQAILRKLLVD